MYLTISRRTLYAGKTSSDVTSDKTSSDVTSGKTSSDVTAGKTSSDVTSGKTSSDVTSGKTSSDVTSGNVVDDRSVCNMIVEIPQYTTKKMEINKEETMNPLMYNIRGGKIRTVEYKARGAEKSGYPFHYGALPQTWEDPTHADRLTGRYGDNDPVDVFDISSLPQRSGSIYSVKILGAFAMIDCDETDWKVVAINQSDDMASSYNDINDVPDNILNTIEDFLINYKVDDTTDNTHINTFADQKIWPQCDVIDIISTTHRLWNNLVSNRTEIAELIKSAHPSKCDNIMNINLCGKKIPVIY
jgi:inorganic pyrophosphatase